VVTFTNVCLKMVEFNM